MLPADDPPGGEAAAGLQCPMAACSGEQDGTAMPGIVMPDIAPCVIAPAFRDGAGFRGDRFAARPDGFFAGVGLATGIVMPGMSMP
ncbi:hypothetical protein [Sphingomonas sp.]|uniref:hypothetical protein n=1 Tax=Sphingomonas sp. TaxID=28214 RepID=UPI0031DB62E0